MITKDGMDGLKVGRGEDVLENYVALVLRNLEFLDAFGEGMACWPGSGAIR